MFLLFCNRSSFCISHILVKVTASIFSPPPPPWEISLLCCCQSLLLIVAVKQSDRETDRITCNDSCTIEVGLLVLFLFLLWLMSALWFAPQISSFFFFFSCLPEPFQCLHRGKRSESAKVVLALTGNFVIRRVDMQSTLQTIVNLCKVKNKKKDKKKGNISNCNPELFVRLLQTVGTC